MFANELPLKYTGTIDDYKDIIEEYHSGKITFEEYRKKFDKRAKELIFNESQSVHINKELLLNN